MLWKRCHPGGVVVGASIALGVTRIVGIDIDAEPERVRADVVTYARAAADLLDTAFSDFDAEVVAAMPVPTVFRTERTIQAIKPPGALEALPTVRS